MASLKEYQMMFQLQAKLNSGFSSTMKSAQSELLALQQKVQDLSRIQSDIAAYEKQQAAVEATRQKLATLQQQYDNIQKEIQETEGFSSSLENQLLSKQQQIDKTSASLEKQTGKLDAMGAALEDAGVDTGNLASESDRLATEIEEVKTEEEAVAESASEMGTRGTEAVDALASALAAAGIVKLLKEIGDAYVTCITNAADFEETMSTVEALSGASAGEMNALSEEAKRLGATTKFTATEAAEAMTYMGMAGWDASDMLAGMDGVLSLAAASGEDLARTSDIVTDNLTAFGLSASDTARFSDVLAAAATNSNTNVSIMGETFKQSASIAGALGYSVEDVAVAVGLMANSGVKGSIAGTALKNTFNGLLEGATLTSEAFGEYEFSALNADGTMKSFSSTIDELRYYFDQMTEAERVNNAMAIAGKRSYNGLLAILNATDEDYASLTASINNCSGAAKNMAQIKMDNMNGQLTLLKSAWDAVTISIGEQFTPALSDLFGVGTEVLGWVNDMIQANPGLVSGITAFIGVIGLATAGITAYSAAAKVMKALDIGKVFTGIPGLVTLATAAIVGGVAAQEAALQDEVSAYTDVLDAHEEATAAYQTRMQEIETEASNTSSLIEQLEGLAGQTSRTAAEKERMAAIVEQLNATVPDLNLSYDKESDSLVGLSGSVKDYVESMYEAQRAQENLSRMIELEGSMSDTSEALAAASDELAKLQTQYDGLVASGGELGGLSITMDEYRVIVANLTDQLASEQQEYDTLNASVEEYYAAQEQASAASDEAVSAAQNVDAVLAELAMKYDEVYQAASESYSQQFALWEQVEGISTTSASTLTSALESQQTYWENYSTNLDTVMAKIAELAANGYDTSNIEAYVTSINDGSAESASAIAGLASAGTTDLQSIGESYGSMIAAQDSAAASTATLETDFSAAMALMRSDLENTVAAMEQSGAATTAASGTMSAYVATIRSYYTQAYNAGAYVAQGAASGMRSVSASPNVSVRGYAVGTTSAEPGFAWVGENGPELMFFNGGEQIMTAQDSANFQKEHQAAMLAPDVSAQPEAAGASRPEIVLTYSPVYTISGVDGAADLESVLRSHDEDLREYIKDVIEDAEADAARRRF